MIADALQRKLEALPRVSTQMIKAADLSRAGLWVQWSEVERVLTTLQGDEQEPPNPLTHELHDLIVLMPDSQVDELVDFVKQLRAARAPHPERTEP